MKDIYCVHCLIMSRDVLEHVVGNQKSSWYNGNLVNREKDVRNREDRCVSLLMVGSHLLLSCLGFSSASYLKVHVKTHHGVPLPQVSRHQESIPNGGAAFHCVRTYGIKGKRLPALHLASLCRTWCCGMLGWA